MLAPNSIINGRYQIVRQVGQGGIGAVYEAIDQRLRATVALKQMLVNVEQYGRAFEREAQLLANLRHGALPKVIDYFIVEQGPFLVMEFIPGPDMSSIMNERRGPFPIDDVMRWADSLLDTLDYLHTLKPPIVHRDIKPQNLKLTSRKEIILLDFGLAKGSIALGTANLQSVTGWTPQYAPLEQINGTGTDPRSDLYSLGATLYHFLTGNPPVSATARATEAIAHRPDPLQPVSQLNSQIPQWINAVIMHSMALNPADRFISAAAMRSALQFNNRTVQQSATVVTQNIDPGLQTIVEPAVADTLKTRRLDESPATNVISQSPSIIPPVVEVKKSRTGLWIAAAFILLLLVGGGIGGGLMLNRWRTQSQTTDDTDASQPTETSSDDQLDTPIPASAITLKAGTEATLGDGTYKLVAAHLLPYGPKRQRLRLRIRLTWNGGFSANFDRDLFHLLVDGKESQPINRPNELVESFSAKDAIVAFLVPINATKAVLEIGRTRPKERRSILILRHLPVGRATRPLRHNRGTCRCHFRPAKNLK